MKISCLICGKLFRFLPRHIASHGVTVAQYRQEFQIPAGQALCTPEYSAAQSEKMHRLRALGAITNDHLPGAVEIARSAGRGVRTDDDLAAQAERAKRLPRNQLPPGARRADGRDADRARESQRRRRASQGRRDDPR